MNKKSMAVLLAGAVTVTAFALPSNAKDAAHSFKSMQKNALQKVLNEMDPDSAAAEETGPDTAKGTSNNLTFHLDEGGKLLLGFATGKDLGWFDNVKVSVETGSDEANMGSKLTLYVNDRKLCTLNSIIDTKNGKLYLSIPELKNQYMMVDLGEYNLKENETIADLLGIKEGVLPETAALPTPEQAKELLSKFGTLAINSMQEGESGEEIISAGGVEKTDQTFTASFSSKDAGALIKAVMEELKNNTVIKDLLDTKAANADDYSYGKFQEAIDKFLASDFEVPENLPLIQEKIWVDGDNVEGALIKFLPDGDDAALELLLQAPVKDNEHGLMFSIGFGENRFEISGKGILDGNLMNANYQVKIGGAEIAELQIKDHDMEAAEKGMLSGSYKIIPSKSFFGFITGALGEIALNADIKMTDTSEHMDLDLVTAVTPLGGISIDSVYSGELDILSDDISDAVDVSGEEEMKLYSEDVTSEEFLQLLKDAGISQALINEIAQSVDS